EDENLPPARPRPGQPRPQEPIGGLDARPRLHTSPLIDGELVAQGKNLELKGRSRSKTCAERGEEGEEDCVHGGRKLPDLRGATSEAPALVPRSAGTALMMPPSKFSGRTTSAKPM